MARVLVLPWMVFGLLVVLVENTPRSNSRGVSGEHFVVLWAIAIALVNDLFFGLQAWHKLRSRFRQVATERFDRKARKSA